MAFLNRDYYYMPYAAGGLSFLTVPAPNTGMQPQTPQLVPPGAALRDQSDSESASSSSLDAWFAAAPHQVAPSLPRPYSSQIHSPAIYKPADRCTMQCCAPAPSSMPVYNVSPAYSLAQAQAGVVPTLDLPAPKPVRLDLLPGPAPPPLRPVAYTPALHGKWANAEYQAFSDTVCYSPHVPRASSAASAGEEYFYEPESTGSSNLSVTMCSSEVPPPKAAAPPIKKERPHSASARSASHAFSPSPESAAARISKPQRSQPRDNSRVGSESGTGRDAPPPPEYTCDICSAVFIRKHDVERHRRSHTGERPFPCLGGCGKAFRRADARARHWGVYRECEWRHARLLEGTPEGARRERRLLKRAKRAELVQLGVARSQIDLILKKM